MYMYTAVISMSFTEKIDVLDMIINILREHEEKLDELVTRLEAVSPVAHVSHSEDELARRFYAPL